MPQYDIGTAHGRIEVDASALGRAISALDILGNRMLLVGGLALAGFGMAITAAAHFETQISRFKAVSGATESDMDKIRKAALKMGQEAGIGATEVAKGFVEIAKSGYSVQQVMEGVGKAAVYLAAAGEIPLADATRILVNTLTQFQLPASDAVHVANLLAGAANESTTEVDELANALRYAGPVAAFAGLTVDDTAVALALFAQAGIRASHAGTTMRGMLLGLIAGTPKAKDALERMGIVTEETGNRLLDATGKLKPLNEVFGLLQEGINKLPPSERTAALNAIFMRRALAGAARAAMEGKGGFDEFAKRIKNGSTAQQVMNDKLDNAEGSGKRAKAGLEAFSIQLGEIFQPVLKWALDNMIKFVNWLQRLSPTTKKWIGIALGASGAAFILGGTMLRLGSAVLRNYRAARDLASAFRILAGVTPRLAVALNTLWTTVLLNPFFWVAVAVIAVAAAFYFLWTRWNQVWNWIRNHPAVAAVLAMLFPYIAIAVLIVGALHWLWQNWRRIWNWIKHAASDAADWVTQAWDDVVAWLDQAWTDIKDAAEDAFNDVVDFFERLPGRLLAGLEALPGLLAYAIGYAVGFMVGAAIWAAQTLFDFFINLPATILGLLIDAGTWLLQTGWDLIVGLATGIWNAMPGIIDFFLNLLGNVLNWIGNTTVTLVEKGFQLLTGFLDGIGHGAVDVTGWFFELPGNILSWIGETIGWLNQAGKDLVKGLWEGILSMGDWLMNKIEDFGQGIIDGFTSAFDVFSPSKKTMYIGRMLAEGLGVGFSDNMPNLGAIAAGMNKDIGVGLSGAIGAAAGRGGFVPAGGSGATVTQNNVIYAWDAREAAIALERERAWAQRTAGVT